MQIVQPTVEEATAGLRALVTILTVDGVLSPVEEHMLDAAQRYILRTELELDSLEPISPEQLAAAMTRPVIREQFAGAMVIHAFASGEPDPRYLEHIEAFSAALGVRVPEVDTLQRWTQERRALLRYDVIRRMYIGEGLARLYEDSGFQGIARALGGFLGLREEPELAARYQALGELPQGSLGRVLFDHYRENNFPLPGEAHGAPEMIVIHDLAHVIGGYSTAPEGELQVAAFSAGFRREGVWSVLLFAMCQFDLGIQVAPVAEPLVGNLDPDRFLAAFVRGARMTVDLFGDWDPWPVMDVQLDELRERYGIGPAPS